MNKAELAAEVAERLSGVDADARQYVDAVFDVIMHRVSAGERVQILGFGTFDSVERAARVGRNPRTGAAIQVPAGVSPRFHAGQTFRAQVTDGSPAAAPAVVVEAEQVVAKPAKAKKDKAGPEKVIKAASEKPAKGAEKKAPKPAGKKAAKSADKKAAKSADKKSPKLVKATKKSAKAAKAGKK
jgi:DNA-binding protein HU-beta